MNNKKITFSDVRNQEIETHTVCSGCKCEMDEDVCWCGQPQDEHRFMEHTFVPYGCCCGFSTGPIIALEIN